MKTRKADGSSIAAHGRRRNTAVGGVQLNVASKSVFRAAGSLSFDDLRAVAERLPGVQVSTSYGTPALKVRGKLMARLHQSDDSIVLRTELFDREILLQSDPSVFFITDHYHDYPWVLLRLATVDRRVLPDLLERAWRLVAPKSLVIRYDAQPGSDA